MLLLILVGLNVHSQSLLDSAKNEIYKINRMFDSGQYINFIVDILYFTDTAYGKFERQEKRVEYSLNNKNYYYKTDGLIYMQNDSFTVNIDVEQRTMLVAKSIQRDLSGQFMLKDFIDFSLNTYDSLFDIDINTLDTGLQKITFVTKPGIGDSVLPGYSSFSITYETDNYFPLKMEMILSEKLARTIPEVDNSLKQKMEFNFSSYRSISTTAIFDENNYFYYDKNTKRYMAAENYKYYRFLTAGMDDEEEPEEKPQLLIETANDQ